VCACVCERKRDGGRGGERERRDRQTDRQTERGGGIEDGLPVCYGDDAVEESVCKRLIIAILIQLIMIIIKIINIIIIIIIIIIKPGVSEPRAVVVTYSDYASRVASVMIEL
jgi:hypothetical protein